MNLVIHCLLIICPFVVYGVCPFLTVGTPPSDRDIVPDTDTYNSALEDLSIPEVMADIYTLLNDSQECWPADEFNGESGYGPLMIRLAWHCAGTFRADGKGGCGGGRQRFYPESSWEDNTNLDKARALLAPIKVKYGDALSWGDLFIFAGTGSIMAMGGPATEVCAGRIDSPDGNLSLPLNDYSTCDVMGNCQRPVGAVQEGLIYVNPAGFMGNPDPTNSTYQDQIREVFDRMGMNDSETVALIGGGHAFGKCHGACTAGAGPEPHEQPFNPWPGNCDNGVFTSGFEGAWSSTPLQWSNEYFTQLVDDLDAYTLETGPGGAYQWRNGNNPSVIMLTADLALAYDDVYKGIVAEYANDINVLNNAFAASWAKLTTNGGTWASNRFCIDADELSTEVEAILAAESSTTTTESEENTTWTTVAVVFIILFALCLVINIYLAIKVNSGGGRSKAHDAVEVPALKNNLIES